MIKGTQPNTSEELFSTNAFVREFCLLGEAAGLTREEYANKIGLKLKSIEDPQVIISKHYIVKGYAIILEQTDDELLGAGKVKLPRGSVDLMVKSACMESNLLHALTAIEQVVKVSQSNIKTNIFVEKNLVHWQFALDVKSEFSLIINSLVICVAHKLISLLVKKEIDLSYISFPNKAPENTSDYHFLFACPIKFSQQHCEIVFDKKWLHSPIHCEYKEVKPYLNIPLSLTNYSLNKLGFIRQIKDILSVYPYAKFPSQQILSEQLGMSVRTLQRKLDNENSSYMQLKDEIRHHKAIFYLNHTNKSFNEIAERCGFSELASFTRAFTRWTGCTPSKYKN